MKINILNSKGNKTKSSIELSESVFGIEPNEHCVYLAVKSEMASLHQGTHQSKNRSAVSGSGKKPYKQKGLVVHVLVHLGILQEFMVELRLDLKHIVIM